MGESRIVRRSNQMLTTPVGFLWFVDRAKSKQYESGLWLIVANVEFRIILSHMRYSNRRAQIKIKIRNLKSKLKTKIDNWNRKLKWEIKIRNGCVNFAASPVLCIRNSRFSFYYFSKQLRIYYANNNLLMHCMEPNKLTIPFF